MTFDLQRPVKGYPTVFNQSGKVLGQIPGLENTMRIRFAGEGLRQAAEDKKLDWLLKAREKMMQPQQSQGGTDWGGLAMQGINLFGSLGGFGGGGGGADIGGAIGGDAGFAGVDSGVLDSVLGNTKGYTSGMTNWF